MAELEDLLGSPEAETKFLQKTRNYQAEMFEESLRRNIIVAMDTGSGKTHVAILRIRAQLDKNDGKISWFLIPGVVLAKQQYEVLSEALPPTSMQFLTGARGVDKWSNQEIWDTIMESRVIISTHQVLLDALYHGFVSLDRIGLLIFDEAHHCVSDHPANQIMREFYHPRINEGGAVPTILGLTASPIMKSDPGQLKIIESNLNAIARTPLIHRDELRAHVRLPTLRTVTYGDKMNLLQSEEQQHIPYYSPEKKGEMSSLLERLQQGPEQHMARSQGQVREKRSFNSLLANLQQGPKVAKPLPPPKHSLGLSFDFDLGPEFTVPDFNVPGLATAVQAPPPPHLSHTPSRDKRPKVQHTPPHVDDDDAEYESIDPETGEIIVSRERPVTPTIVENDDKEGMDEDYEKIDPETGEAVFFGGIISNKRKSIAESISSDECEEIDPETGEVITPRRRVHPPPSSRPRIQHSRVLESLRRAYESMDIMEDPWVIQQKKRNAMDLWETITNRKTYSQDQIRGFVRKAEYIFQECGEWATDWFISEVIRKFMYRETVLEDEDDVKVIDDMEPEEMYFGTRKEAAYMRSILQKIQIPKDLGPIEGRVTEKVDKLIDILLHEYSAEHRGFSGLVFVEQRVCAATIAKIISQHPRTRNLFKPGTMVGGSDGAFKKRRLISEVIVNLKQDNTLKDFRTGDKNLIIATAAIEEGLDVQDCHLVVCFDLPTNLKSFVQRRGRARREASSYVLMLDFNAPDRVATFEAMEQEMIKMYSDPDRELEEVEDEQEDLGTRCMKVEKTGALLMLQNVLPRLQHFCACLPTREFVDSRPEFRTWNEAAPGARGCWSAEVVLPNAIDAEIRRTSSLETWQTEKAAKKDAAFEAFVKLYKHGLVDDHLMPLVKGEFQNEQEVQKRQPKVEVEERKDIWESLDRKWNEGGNLYVSTLEVTFSTRETVGINLILPVELPEMEPLRLFWYRDETAIATFGRSRRIGYDPKLIDRGKRAAYRLFKTIFSLRMEEDRQDFSYLFVPCEGECWDLIPEVQVNALEAITNNRSMDIGLIRGQNDVPYIFRRLRTDLNITEAEDFKGQQTQTQCTLDNVRRDQPLLEVTQLSKQRDFLHLEAGRRKETKTLFLLPEFVTVDTLPWKYSQLALLLPFLINRVEKALLAADLRQNLGFQELPNTLMVHALTASSARDPVDYQRLEFLGDSILKVLASVALMDEFPLYHEGYLTAAKDHIVSNNTSSKAAAKLHLSRWINTASFTAAKWRPRYAGPSTKPASKLLLSTKILADVVEAIIGVSYLTGGYEGATKCCATFGLGTEWRPLKERVKGLQAKAAENDARHERNYPHYFDELETLLGYSFRNRVLLLEATTHLSYGAADSTSTSYQRLEFLGDAVLDTIIVNTLYHFPGVKLSHINMHHLKSCCVNAHLLAFLCAGATTEVERMEPHPTGETPLQPVRRTVSLYRFLRANNPGLHEAQRKFVRRYEQYKDEIFAQLKTPGHPPWKDAAPPEYPWEDLQKLDAPKHLSDIIESIIGAIWIDSDGDFEVVKRFLERLGVIDILERLVTGNFVVNHPLSRFGIKAAGDGKMGVVKYECELEEGRSTYWCEVRINDDPIARVEGCVSRQHARTVAAREGLRVLEAREEAERRKKAAEEEVRKDEMEEKEEEEEEIEEKAKAPEEVEEKEEEEEEEIEEKAKAPEEVEEPVGLSLRGGDRTGEEDEDADEEVLPLSFLLGYTYGLV